MGLSRPFLVSTAILLGAMAVYADGISPSDPQMIIGRGRADQTALTTLSPLFGPVPKGGGLFGFVNDTGSDLIGLVVTIDFKDAKAAMAFASNCIFSASPMANSVFTNLFNACSFSRHGHTLTVTLTGGSGILPGQDFFIDLNDGATLTDHPGKGEGEWAGLGGESCASAPSTKRCNGFEIQPVSTPEPGTLALLVTGFAGFWLRRKRASV